MQHKRYGLILLCAGTTWVQAEIIHDNSFSKPTVLEGSAYQILATQGLEAGDNLFHSFSQFNLSESESATFEAAANTQRIISRVTGGDISTLDGAIRSSSAADMYFFNPAGIAFGEHAQIDVGAAFYASTASYLDFSDGQRLSLQDTDASQWSSAAPSQFGFSQNANLSLNKTQIDTTKATSLHFSAQQIDANQAKIQTAGSIQLYGLDADSQLNLNNPEQQAQQATIQLNNSELSNLNGQAKIALNAAEIALDNSRIDTLNRTPITAANIELNANRVQLDNGSVIQQTTNAQGQAGDVIINANEYLGLAQQSAIRNRSNSSGTAGDIQIQTKQLAINGDSSLSASSFSFGKGGNIQIDATSLSVAGDNSFISSQSNSRDPNAIGADAGNIVLNLQELNVSDGAAISSASRGAGDAGTIQINSDEITVEGENSSGLNSRIQLTSIGTGAAGTLNIKTDSLNLKNGAFIATDTLTFGAGGVVDIEAKQVSLSGENNSGAGSFIVANAAGAAHGGSIRIVSEQLSLEDGAQIATASFGRGNGGDIHIETAQNLHISGEDSSGFQSGLFASNLDSTNLAAGKGGNITVLAGQLTLENNARINSETSSQGAGGQIQIQAEQIHLRNNAQIQANSESTGDAGTIHLQAGDKIIISHSKVNTSSSQADGGNIIIDTPSYLFVEHGEITTSVAAADGNGGNITLTPEFLLLDNARVVAQAVAGDGGNIDVNTSALYKFSPSLISASSELGIDGIVAINTPDEDVSEGLLALVTEFNQSKIAHNVCQSAEAGQQASQMLVLQYLGSPLSSDDWQPSHSQYYAQLTAPEAINQASHQALFRLVCAKTTSQTDKA